MNPYLLLGGAIALVLAITAAIFGLNKWEGNIRESGRAEVRAEWAAANAKSEAEQRKIEQNRAKAQQEAQDASVKAIAKAKSDAANARASADGLRGDLAALRARIASGDPSAPSSGQTSAKVDELFGVCTDRYRAMAEEADASRSAGTFCQTLYESLGASP